MTILPIPLTNCSSVVDFFSRGGKIEVPRPQQCLFSQCGLQAPLRKNGSYLRQVVFWGFFFVVRICRFRCWRCGRTVSCPYGWLVPYRRFTAEVVSAAIGLSESEELGYRHLGSAVADLELSGADSEIQKEPLYKQMIEEHADRQPGAPGQPPCRPAHTTVFYWVAFLCQRVEALLSQMQKELVQERKRGKGIGSVPLESAVENPNGHKAATVKKRESLDRLAFAGTVAQAWLGNGERLWYRLRAYFLMTAESRKDLLTETAVRLPITHTFEPSIF
jgi:hypothetical protein